MPSVTLVFINLDGEKAKRPMMAMEIRTFFIWKLKNEID
jgi:hypothetical protein